MRTAAIATSLLLTLALAGPGFAAPRSNASPTATVNTTAQKKNVQPPKPTWEQCFNMSVERGFNHEVDEWQQSIVDCQEGKVPLK